MIEMDHASRWFGQVIGLSEVSCQIGPGLTALLGPNGAGKSTMLKLITGQIKPSSGAVRVLGEPPFANARVLGQLGYCPENDSFYEDMTGREFVTLMAALSGYTGAERAERVSRVIERVGMTDRCDRRIGGYSKGMRQRIKIAQGILHDPKVLVLDEPLNGLDPPGRREVTNLMMELAEAGVCVLISSHILYEVEQLTHSILLMQRGRVLARGSLEEIRGEMDRTAGTTPRQIVIRANQPRKLAMALLDDATVGGVRLDPINHDVLEVETRDPAGFFTALPRIVLDGGFQVESMQSPDDHLEAIIRILLSRK